MPLQGSATIRWIMTANHRPVSQRRLIKKADQDGANPNYNRRSHAIYGQVRLEILPAGWEVSQLAQDSDHRLPRLQYGRL